MGAGTPSTEICEIAIDTDFELFMALGSDVDATVAFVESIIRRLDVIFERDTGVTIELTAVVVRSTPSDPYTSSDPSTLMSQLQNEWAGGAVASVQRDVTHLMTGRDLSGATIALAFPNAMCNPSIGYGLGQTLWNPDPDFQAWVHAFSLGLNFGALSCGGPDCRIMCGSAGGCAGDVTSFGAASSATIRANAAAFPCLRDLAPPLATPLFESFASAQVDETVWVSNPAGGVSIQSSQPPSPPFAARVTATDVGSGVGERWITNKILLDGVAGAQLSYQVQPRGVASGGALHVDFVDEAGVWSRLDTVVSDGTSPSTFAARSVALPGAAFHGALQLRFTAAVDDPLQEWFFDDMRVEVTAREYCIAAANSVSATGANLTLGGGSSVSIAANDFGLLATSCPPGSFGIYIYSDDRQQTPLGNGFLCVNGSPIFRAAVEQADAFGISSFALDQTALPPMSVIVPGDTVRFQLWYRDSVGMGFNLTNGLEATFLP